MAGTGGCAEVLTLLNAIFQIPAILNDGHEIAARLRAGDDFIDVVADLNGKFGRPGYASLVESVGEAWPPLHRAAVTEMVRWALDKLDTDDRIAIEWKGNAESPQTVTKFELRDHTLVIDFAHPPVVAGRTGA
jgi:hypothetical protein